MSRQSIWEVLGIAATRESAAIRRAYARKLKTTQPEDDPEGFKVLRAAYEAALRIANNAADPLDEAEPALDAVATAEQPPVVTEVEPLPDPEVLRLQEALTGLALALYERESLSTAFAEHLRSALRSPLLANIQIEQQVEAQLAELLAHSIPRSDPLLGSVAQRFGWLRDAHRLTGAPAAIVARLRDLEFLESLADGDSPYASAFANLQRPPVPVWSWLRAHIHRPNRPSGQQLLTLLRDQHPALLQLLNAKSIAWWDRLLSRPQPSILLVTLGAIFTSFSIVLVPTLPAEEPRLLLPLGNAALWTAVVLWRLFLIDWPRVLMHRHWPLGAPLWLKTGWLPLAAASLLLATAPVGTLLPTLLALLALQWNWIAVRPMGLGSLSNLNVATLCTVFAPTVVVGLWWVAVMNHVTSAMATQSLTAALVLMLSSALGSWEMQACWVLELTALQRRVVLGILLIWSAASAAAVWWLAPLERWQAWCATLLLIGVCLQRPVHLTNRQLSILIGVWVVGLAMSAGIKDSAAIQLRTAALGGVGMVLNCTLLVTVLFGIWNELTGVTARIARGDERR